MQSRMVFKVISTGLNFFMSIVIGILVPRAIGPESYGEFNYIISTYAFILQFLMFTSSTAYIYFLSHGKHKVENINAFYVLFLMIISFLTCILGFVSINSELGLKYLWNELDDHYLLYLGLVFGLFTNLQQRLIEFSDSTTQTIVSEKLKLVSRMLMVASVVVFIYLDILDIYWFLILSILNFALFFIFFFRYIDFKISSVRVAEIKEIVSDFYVYLKPLVIFSFISAAYAYLGKYALQSSSGSIEQGYYNFAYQLALIPVTFISSIMAIYMSEMTKKFQAGDVEGVKKIFMDNIFKVYAIHALIAFFMLINSKSIIVFSVGDDFLEAAGALEALSIFSLLHTFGMLSGNLFFSTGRNKQYSIINSIVMILGSFYLSYLLFFSSIDAHYLAIIMMFVYMVRVFIQLYLNLLYLDVDVFEFVFELVVVTIVIFTCFKIVNILGLNILVNLFVSLLIILGVNFIFKDYMNFKELRVKL